MLTVDNTLQSLIVRGVVAQPSFIKEHQFEHVVEPVVEGRGDVSISDDARRALALEEMKISQAAQVTANERNAQDKEQYAGNLQTFVQAAQRYAQHDIVQPIIKHDNVTGTYSLIANKVVATSSSNGLER